MNNIEPPDTHRINAAMGWLELGNPRDAGEELKQLSPRVGKLPEVLEIWWMIHAQLKDWEAALQAAGALVDVSPDDHTGWIHQAYSLHEMRRTQEAWDVLLPAAARFPSVGIIPYNLACYSCQLGAPDRAMLWLRKAIELDGLDEVRQRALSDADLAPLKGEIDAL